MRVLFVSGAEMPDYQCDMLLHGLRELLGSDIVDVKRVWYMYAAEFANNPESKAELYGRGFTMYGLLDDDIAIDRSDIENKIVSRFFDLIVYGSVRRCQDYLSIVLLHYPAEQIVFVDGEDDQTIVTPLLGRGLYFKRELSVESRFLKPIHFAIPRSKIENTPSQKTRVEAFIDPRDRTTYIYDTEEAYYRGYSESLFGFTQKKAGWDCLRHYEIMANSCVPHFENIESCPALTMMFLPKYELMYAKVLIASNGNDYFETSAGRAIWEDLQHRIDHVLHNHLTTVALARYFVDTIRTPENVPMISSVRPIK